MAVSSSIAITGGGTRDIILQARQSGVAYTATDTCYLFDYDGASLVQRYQTAFALGGIATRTRAARSSRAQPAPTAPISISQRWGP
jgi:hypothetical protein